MLKPNLDAHLDVQPLYLRHHTCLPTQSVLVYSLRGTKQKGGAAPGRKRRPARRRVEDKRGKGGKPRSSRRYQPRPLKPGLVVRVRFYRDRRLLSRRLDAHSLVVGASLADRRVRSVESPVELQDSSAEVVAPPHHWTRLWLADDGVRGRQAETRIGRDWCLTRRQWEQAQARQNVWSVPH